MRYFIVSYAYEHNPLAAFDFGVVTLEQRQYPNLTDIERESGEESAIPVSIMELSESDWLDWNRDTEGK